MRMQHRPLPQTGVWTLTFPPSIFYWYDSRKNKEVIILEKLILTFGRLGFTKCYYEDFGCSTKYEFEDKLEIIGKELLANKKKRLKRAKYGDWLYKIDHTEANDLATTDHHYRSRQSVQALMLVEQKNKYPCPSSYQVDSS